MMKTIRFLFVALAAMTLLTIGSYGQTRKSTTKRTTPAKNTAATIPPLDVRAARVKVSQQYDYVTDFSTKYGPVAQDLEAFDTESRTTKMKKEVLDKNAKDKQRVIAAIRNVREGLLKLESEFKVKPALKKYLPMIQGISALAGQSEDSAIAGKFVAANGPLRTIQQKLSQTMTAMPNVPL